MLDSSLACVFLYTCPIVVTAVFRTRNIHTFHSAVYFSWPLGCLGVSLCLGRLFQNEEYSHTFFAMVLVCDRASSTLILLFVGAFSERGIFTYLFACLFVLDLSLACVVLYTCPIVVTAFFRTRNIHTLHSPLYFCWRLGVWGAFFGTRNIHTPSSTVSLC